MDVSSMHRFEVIHGSGGFASLRVRLSKGESIKCEPDAVVSASEHIHIDAEMDAGVVRGLLRCLLAGESLFVAVLVASGDDNDALLCPEAPGDVELLHLRQGDELLIAKGSFLAADATVILETAMLPGFSRGRAFFSGTGLFMLRALGSGVLAVNAEGGIVRHTLGPGERRQVDHGHLLAWTATMNFSIGLAGGHRSLRRRGLLATAFASVASGEGFMVHFVGPGQVWVQTHRPLPLAEPGRARRSRKSGLGGLPCLCSCLLMWVVVLCPFVFFGAVILRHGTDRKVLGHSIPDGHSIADIPALVVERRRRRREAAFEAEAAEYRTGLPDPAAARRARRGGNRIFVPGQAVAWTSETPGTTTTETASPCHLGRRARRSPISTRRCAATRRCTGTGQRRKSNSRPPRSSLDVEASTCEIQRERHASLVSTTLSANHS